MNMKNDATLARRNRSMIDGQIVLALAEAFLLGIFFGSGLEIIVRSAR
jgi:hypothetical protein